jgi:hypothetical protein
MKSLREYITESQKTYKFKIRVAGEVPEHFPDMMERALQKYECIGVSSGKKTPITEKPLDFPQLQNMEVTHWEVEVKYPTTSHVLEQYLVQSCTVPHSHIIVRGENDPIESQQEPTKETPYESILDTEDMGGESAQKEAGENRVMDLLKELEAARKEREIDPIAGIKAGG